DLFLALSCILGVMPQGGHIGHLLHGIALQDRTAPFETFGGNEETVILELHLHHFTIGQSHVHPATFLYATGDHFGLQFRGERILPFHGLHEFLRAHGTLGGDRITIALQLFALGERADRNEQREHGGECEADWTFHGLMLVGTTKIADPARSCLSLLETFFNEPSLPLPAQLFFTLRRMWREQS